MLATPLTAPVFEGLATAMPRDGTTAPPVEGWVWCGGVWCEGVCGVGGCMGCVRQESRVNIHYEETQELGTKFNH